MSARRWSCKRTETEEGVKMAERTMEITVLEITRHLIILNVYRDVNRGTAEEMSKYVLKSP